MIEEVYVMVIAFHPRTHSDFIFSMAPYMTQAKIKGAKIESCRLVDFPQAIQVLRVLESLNGAASIDPLLFKEEGVLRLRIRTKEPIRYRSTPWLNSLLKDYLFTPFNVCSGAYFFYLTKNDGVLQVECPNQLVTETVEIDETNNDDDDFTYMQTMAPYLDRLLHFGDADKIFPDVTAKLLLQFGE